MANLVPNLVFLSMLLSVLVGVGLVIVATSEMK